MDHKKWNNTGLYIIIMSSIITIIVKFIWHWDATSGLFDRIVSVVSPFIIGLFIAYIINPLVDFFYINIFKRIFQVKHKKISKGISIIFSYVLVVSIVATCIVYIIPQIIESLTQMKSILDTAQTGYNKIIREISKLNTSHPELNLSIAINFVKSIPEKLEKSLMDVLLQVIPTLYDKSLSLISGILDFIIAIIVSIYMLFDKPRLLNNITRGIYAFLPEKKADKLLVICNECNKIFNNFIVGKFIDSTIIGFLCWLLMTILNIPYALVISIIVGITNMIPYFGPFIGAVPGILLLLIVDFYYALIFTVLIIVLQQFDGLILGPKILGQSTGLRPIWIIFAITVGGSIGGVAGMFLGVPVTAVIAFLLEDVMVKKLKKKNIVFETNPETEIISKDTLITEDKSLDVIEDDDDEKNNNTPDISEMVSQILKSSPDTADNEDISLK